MAQCRFGPIRPSGKLHGMTSVAEKIDPDRSRHYISAPFSGRKLTAFFAASFQIEQRTGRPDRKFMNRLTGILSITLVLCFSMASSVHAEHQGPLIAGWLEVVIISPWKLRLRAKLDTGAKTSSIHATHIEKFKRDGRQWVRFQLPQGKFKKAVAIIAEMPVLREVAIKRHNLDPVIRPVVELGFCIDAHFYRAEFTLSDRSQFNYPVLLGRRFLKDNILVDAGKIFMHNDRKKMRKCIDSALQQQAKDDPQASSK